MENFIMYKRQILFSVLRVLGTKIEVCFQKRKFKNLLKLTYYHRMIIICTE